MYGKAEGSKAGINPGATITLPASFGSNYNYTIKPKPEKILAKIEGYTARCGHCNHKLGEFSKAEGEIKCSVGTCRVINKVKI